MHLRMQLIIGPTGSIDRYMSRIDVSAIDLNLLVSLDALLRERSVTKAARRIGLGQSAMSYNLGRLRALFDDPLFVRSGRGIAPTPRAEGLTAPVRDAIAAITRVLHDGGPFDPAQSSRRFSLLCSDLLATFLPELVHAMSATAPNVTLELASPSASSFLGTVRAGDADLSLSAPQPESTGCVQVPVGELGWVVLGRADHALVGRSLTRAAYGRASHITVRAGTTSRSVVADACAAAGIDRRIGLVLPSFVAAPFAVARTDLLFTAPERPLAPVVELLGLATAKPPIAIPPVPILAMWSERLDADPGQRWFRETIIAAVRRLLTPRPKAATPSRVLSV